MTCTAENASNTAVPLRHKDPAVQAPVAATAAAPTPAAQAAPAAPTSVKAQLQRIYDALSREQLSLSPLNDNPYLPPMQGTRMTYWSIFSDALDSRPYPPAAEDVSEKAWALVERAAEEDPACGAAIASLVGLAMGDAVGHPMEFVAVDPSLPRPDGTYEEDRPHLIPHPVADEQGVPCVQYHEEENKFDLKRGQWTDDCSMALCLADSLLANKSYHGGDARIRWHLWWNQGYCNAFRFIAPRLIPNQEDPTQVFVTCPRSSVGLGGNIAMSIMEVNSLPQERWAADKVPAIFGSKNEDAGNGSIMRLAPVPICFHDNLAGAMEVAEKQSRGTHPGPDAVACCKFMTYLMIKAFEAHKRREPIGKDGASMRVFLDKIVSDFVSETKAAVATDTGLAKVHAVLLCKPPTPDEVNWNWRTDRLEIPEAIESRCSSEDGRYNGYPVIPTYWGAYCMDGLAMALWGLHQSESFEECVIKTVNLLGDADTTGAIASQMAGAIYGWKGITTGEMAKLFLRDLKKWDPYCEVCCCVCECGKC